MSNELIQKMAEKLGVTAEHIWGVLVRQAPITCSIHLAALAAMAVLLVWTGRRLYVWEPNDGDKLVITVLWALAAFIGIMCFSTMGDALSGFVNPEYWALKQLLP